MIDSQVEVSRHNLQWLCDKLTGILSQAAYEQKERDRKREAESRIDWGKGAAANQVKPNPETKEDLV